MYAHSNDELTYKVKNHIQPNRFGKAQFTETLLSNKFYKKFRIKYPEYKDKRNPDLRKDWKDIATALMDIVIEEPDGIQIGKNMGEFKLGLLRVHNIIDKKTSNEIGKPVRFMDYETNRKPGKVVWKTEYARIVHFFLRYLGFKPCREVQAKCFKNFKEQGHIYKDVTDKHKLIK